MSQYVPKKSCPLWVYKPEVKLNLNIQLNHIKQKQRDCVPCILAMITNKKETDFYNVDNSNPIDWSNFLAPYGFKLATCIYNFSLLETYQNELLKGTFLVGIYNGEIEEIADDTSNKHLIMIHKGVVYDSNVNKPVKLLDSIYLYNYINRMYRLVPLDYPHGI